MTPINFDVTPNFQNVTPEVRPTTPEVRPTTPAAQATQNNGLSFNHKNLGPAVASNGLYVNRIRTVNRCKHLLSP
jgi:hypothetical protein